MHIYSSPDKRLRALEVATAAAGFTGFGIPIVHNLIMCAWGAAESINDLNELYAGKSLPFIKSTDSWSTDLLSTGFKNRASMQGEDSIMSFDYHDYLRLLLLVKDKDVKMNRIEDLIQLNMQKINENYKLSSSNAYIRLKVQASIKYWFMTKLFAPADKRTNNGRHLIKVEAWRGY
jgi:hypothetical protein